MNYDGQSIILPLGQVGLFTDAPQSLIPNSGLIRANNVTYYNNVIQKDFGSRRWNSTALPGSIVRAKSVFVDSQSQQQRTFCLCSDGNLYKFSNYFTSTLVQPTISTDPVTLNYQGHSSIGQAGNEITGNPKKTFILNGHDSPQVISGDSNVRHSITKPAADWTGTYQPFGGIIHRGQLYMFGNGNNPHSIYASNASDHEDFQTIGSTNVYNIYPGEYDGLVCAAVFRGRLFVLKYPLGVYYLVDDDPSTNNWYFTKQSDDFGACSPQSAAIVQDDLIIANNYGSLSSMKAALVFGDLLQKDIFYQTYNYRFAEQEVRPDITQGRSMVYFSKRKQLFTTFQSNLGSNNDRINVIDYKDQNNAPKVSWTNKDQANCLFTMRNNVGVASPFYSSSDGYIYEMGSQDRWVGDVSDVTQQKAYMMDAQTPHMDFGQGNVYSPGTGNALLGSQMKTFDFLELEYEPTGDWNVYVDVFIDGVNRETVLFNLGARSNLSEMPLNSSPADGLAGFFRRQQIHGQGRTISLRFYNSGLGQDVRLVRAIIYYRLSGQQQMVK